MTFGEYALAVAALLFAGVAVWQAVRAGRADAAARDALTQLAAVSGPYTQAQADLRAARSTLDSEKAARADDAARHEAGMRRVQQELDAARQALRARESGGDALGRVGK